MASIHQPVFSTTPDHKHTIQKVTLEATDSSTTVRGNYQLAAFDAFTVEGDMSVEGDMLVMAI